MIEYKQDILRIAFPSRNVIIIIDPAALLSLIKASVMRFYGGSSTMTVTLAVKFALTTLRP